MLDVLLWIMCGAPLVALLLCIVFVRDSRAWLLGVSISAAILIAHVALVGVP